MQESNSNSINSSTRAEEPDSSRFSSQFQTLEPNAKPYAWTTTDELSSPTESFDADDLKDIEYDANSPTKAYMQVGDSVTVEHLEKLVVEKSVIEQKPARNVFLPPKPAKSAFDEIEYQRRSELSEESQNSQYGGVTAMKQLGEDDLLLETRESCPSESFSEYRGDNMCLQELIESSSHSRNNSTIDDSNTLPPLVDSIREAAKECGLPTVKK